MCVLRSRADAEHLFPVQPNYHMVRRRLALGQQITLANNHPLLHSYFALLARRNQPDWVFKTGQCIGTTIGDWGRLHADTLFRHAPAQIHLDQTAELVPSKPVKNIPLSCPGWRLSLFQGCQDGDVSVAPCRCPKPTSPCAMLAAAS